MWNFIEPWIDRRQYAFVSFSVIVGLWLLFSSITTQKVSSPTDLVAVDGTLSKYSFVDGKKGTKQYFIWLTEYETTFQIPADFLDYFDKRLFENVIDSGQKLVIGISKADKTNLTQLNDRVRIYDLKMGDNTFLNSSSTVKQDNNILQYIIGPIFIIAGISFYFYRHKKLRDDYR